MLSFVLTLLLAGPPQSCPPPQPGPDWVCVNGGWLPPGHPGIPADEPPPPPPPAGWRWPVGGPREATLPNPAAGDHPAILHAARTGEPLPAGTYRFDPPLVLRNGAGLTGQGPVVLRPTSGGPNAIVIENMSTANGVSALRGIHVVAASPTQRGVVIRGTMIELERMFITGFDTGVLMEWAVNVAIRDTLISKSRWCMNLQGYGGPTPQGPHSVTTVTVARTRCAGGIGGIRVGHTLSLLVHEQSIIEGNSGHPLYVAPSWGGAAIQNILFRDAWMEANGLGVVDAVGAVRYEGFQPRW